MILTGNEIIKQVEIGDIIIDPFNIDQVGPNSYDLRLDEDLILIRDENTNLKYKLPKEISPQRLYLGNTIEVCGSEKYVPLLDGRSSWARLGLQVHMTAGFGDLGFIGQWTLEITTQALQLVLKKGQRICQVSFWKAVGDRSLQYNGKYKNSRGIIESRLEDDK